MKKVNILSQPMKAATSPSEAWNRGCEYFQAVEAEAYKKLSKEQLAALLCSACALQTESGCIALFEDSTMPGDARVDIIYKPSYATAAIGIYTKQRYPEIFDEELEDFFQHLLKGAFQHGIVGHGIEAEETVRRTLLMLCKAGLRNFLVSQHKDYLPFAHTIHKYMTHFEELRNEIDAKGIIVTADGFSTDSINHLIKELVAYWNGNTRPVFVYGTLMADEPANHMLDSGEFAGRFQLKNYAMYNLESYPGIQPCAGESVVGELYFVSDEVITQLDAYEGEGSLYLRRSVTLHQGRSRYSAEAYIYNRDISGCSKMREPWNAHDEDLVWYAGYGSNLSSKRFSCYISGGTCTENGRTYEGSSDSTPPRAVKRASYPGELYFGNTSKSWGGAGVAFYEPTEETCECGYVYMKLYLITRQQLHDVMEQEGPGAHWYGRLICLEVDSHGLPVYTLTSETHRSANAPSPAYVQLISQVLKDEFRLSKTQIANYLRIRF